MRRLTCLKLMALGTGLIAASPTLAQESLALAGPYTLLLESDSTFLLLANGSIRRDGDLGSVTTIVGMTTEVMQQTENLSHLALAMIIDCSNSTATVVKGVGFYADGRYASTTPEREAWDPIVAGTPMAEVRAVVCDGAKPTGRDLGNDPGTIVADYRRRRD